MPVPGQYGNCKICGTEIYYDANKGKWFHEEPKSKSAASLHRKADEPNAIEGRDSTETKRANRGSA